MLKIQSDNNRKCQVLTIQGTTSADIFERILINISLEQFHFTLGNIYLFKINNRNTRKRCEICSKLTN